MGAKRTRTVKPPDVRRQEILDATEAVVVEAGREHLKVDTVAARAEIAVGTIYRYYGSKDDLLSAVRERYVARLATSVSDVSDEAASTSAAKVRRAIESVFEFSVRNAVLHHALFQRAGVGEEGVFASLTDAFSPLIVEGVKHGEFDVPDVAATALYLVHGLHGLLVTTAHNDADTVTAVGWTLAERTLGTSTPATR